ncbi:MAG: hypothetical protein K2X77_24680 [Candidatus Obscuribacterales bacterium]|nr:hypothetical protein [Candidatus Obscuribacterales bacterium]
MSGLGKGIKTLVETAAESLGKGVSAGNIVNRLGQESRMLEEVVQTMQLGLNHVKLPSVAKPSSEVTLVAKPLSQSLEILPFVTSRQSVGLASAAAALMLVDGLNSGSPTKHLQVAAQKSSTSDFASNAKRASVSALDTAIQTREKPTAESLLTMPIMQIINETTTASERLLTRVQKLGANFPVVALHGTSAQGYEGILDKPGDGKLDSMVVHLAGPLGDLQILSNLGFAAEVALLYSNKWKIADHLGPLKPGPAMIFDATPLQQVWSDTKSHRKDYARMSTLTQADSQMGAFPAAEAPGRLLGVLEPDAMAHYRPLYETLGKEREKELSSVKPDHRKLDLLDERLRVVNEFKRVELANKVLDVIKVASTIADIPKADLERQTQLQRNVVAESLSNQFINLDEERFFNAPLSELDRIGKANRSNLLARIKEKGEKLPQLAFHGAPPDRAASLEKYFQSGNGKDFGIYIAMPVKAESNAEARLSDLMSTFNHARSYSGAPPQGKLFAFDMTGIAPRGLRIKGEPSSLPEGFFAASKNGGERTINLSELNLARVFETKELLYAQPPVSLPDYGQRIAYLEGLELQRLADILLRHYGV